MSNATITRYFTIIMSLVGAWRTYVRVVDSRGAGVVLLLAFFVVSSAWVFNLNSRGVNRPHVDEWHTLVLGTQHVSPFEDSVPTARVGEMNRWFVRLLHPMGIYYMNSRMGGEHYQTGWDYPGGYYLREHFTDTATIRRDPNVQDYVFFLRWMFGVLAIISFCMVMGVLLGRFGSAAAATYGSLVLANPLVFSQFEFFYSETTLFVLFNTTAVFYLRAGQSTTSTKYRIPVWSGVMSAAAVSTKLTGILIAGPLLVHAVVDTLGGQREAGKNGGGVRMEMYLLSAAVSLVVINLYSESMFGLINETLANVYHFATGHITTHEGGVELLARLVDDLGYLTVLLFGASLLWIVTRLPIARVAPVITLAIIIIFVLWSFSNAAVYLSRNVASVFVAMSFIICLGVGNLIEGLRAKYEGAAAVGSVLVMVVLAGLLVGRYYEMPSLTDTFFERNRERIEACSSVGAVGLPQAARRILSTARGDNVVFFDRLRGPFNISEDPGMFDRYGQYGCLVVYREGQTKQISNYAGPRFYELADRVGNLFFFDRMNEYEGQWTGQRQHSASATGVAGSPSAPLTVAVENVPAEHDGESAFMSPTR